MRFHTLDGWLQWQEGLHPRPIELGLERVGTVWKRLRPSGLQCPAIAVAGTNGKGSSARMLETILGQAGYRTGCYTSPHLLRYSERIRVAGAEIEAGSLCAAFDRVDQSREGVSLTYFEFGTLAALDLFARRQTQVAILEVGLGGRLDAVNILDADAALVTTVDLDHQDWLGPDRERIALEKAGIFRAGRPAVIGQRAPPVNLVSRAREIGALTWRAGRDFSWRPAGTGWDWHGPGRCLRGLPRPALRGTFQLDNAAGVLMLLQCLQERLPVTLEAVHAGLKALTLPGRFQVVPGTVPLVLDVAHNPQAARCLYRNLEDLPCRGRTLAVFALLSDKDASGVIAALAPAVDAWFLGGLSGPRSVAADTLRTALRRVDGQAPASCHGSVVAAFAAAQREAVAGDRLLVCGSFRTVAAVLERLAAA